MRYLNIILLILAFGTNIAVPQCVQQEILDLTSEYLAQQMATEDNTPITVFEASASAQIIFNEMVKLMGIDGDFPWAINEVYTLLNVKGTRLRNYVTHVNHFLYNYFHNTYMPSIRNALSEFLWDQQIQSLVEQLIANWTTRQKYVEQYLVNLYNNLNKLYYQNVDGYLDINRRAIAARGSDQDLSTLESELKTCQAQVSVHLAKFTTNADDVFDKGVRGLVAKFNAIVAEINQRVTELESQQNECTGDK